MRTVPIAGAEQVPQLGQGTWKMGERTGDRANEVKAIQLGMELGLTLIDTAEMYGEGGAEEVVAEAVKGRRDQAFIVSKVYPHNASRQGAVEACERSLKRLATDRIDLYLLHWQGSFPLADTIAAFEQLRAAGKIRHWGVSNLDAAAMKAVAVAPSGANCRANQVLYHLGERGVEFDLIGQSAKAGIAVMAYTPLGGSAVTGHKTVAAIAKQHGVSPATIAIAWTLRHPHVISIPKSAKLEHVRDNARAADLVLAAGDLAALDAAFPPPRKAAPLAIA